VRADLLEIIGVGNRLEINFDVGVGSLVVLRQLLDDGVAGVEAALVRQVI
jgi:hypothetical protein